jgi:hypothetical protein
MTDRPPPRRRASKGELRWWAWVAGAVAFLAPAAALGAAPKPAAPQASSESRPPVEVVRTITRRVIVVERPAEAPVLYVSAPSGGSGGTVAASSSGSSGSAPPAPPPVTSTGGS